MVNEIGVRCETNLVKFLTVRIMMPKMINLFLIMINRNFRDKGKFEEQSMDIIY